MMHAETWLGERMTVRRWLVVLCGVAVVATVVAALAVAALRPADDPATDEPLPATPAAAADQRPTAVDLVVNVGSFSDLDGRAGVTLDVFPMTVPIHWTVTIKALPPAPGGPPAPPVVREIDLNDGEARRFATTLDDAVRHPDPDTDLTIGGSTIHAVDVGPGEYHFDLRGVGTLRLDADGMADLKRLLDRAEAQRAWLMPRTAALRGMGTSVAGARGAVRTAAAHPDR